MKTEAHPCLVAANQLADKLRQCQSWAEVESTLAAYPDHKTDAWQLMDADEKSRLKELKKLSTEALAPEPTPPASTDVQAFAVGERVIWQHGCPSHLQSWNPFVVRQVEGEVYWLDWVATPVRRSKLIWEEAMYKINEAIAMNHPEDERQKIIEALNASLELPSPEWIPIVDAQVEAFYFNEWLPATILSCPNNHSDPQQRISGWKIRLDSGHESYVWKSEHLKPAESDSSELPF